jgi:predicted DNA-binding protein with PD1-like motif
MKHIRAGSTYVIRLDRGEKVVETLTRFCEKRKVRSAFFQGIGTCRRAELGFFLMDKGRYKFRKVPGDQEITSLTGNVSLLDGKPFIHAHIVLGGSDFISHSGHLKEAEVLATCEIVLTPLSRSLTRTHSRSTGLTLLDF